MNSAAKKTCPEPVEWKRNQQNRRAFSLMEMLVVMGIIAILVGLSLPALNALQKSYDSTGSESMIESALSTARTLAISKGKYAGVRFQKAGDPNNALDADQYIVFIIYQPRRREKPFTTHSITLTDMFKAVEGYKPIKLPSNIGVMDMEEVNSGADIEDNNELFDSGAFSVVFSLAGKLVIRDVQTRNKDGRDYNDTLYSDDDIFNIKLKVNDGTAMFIQDDNETYTPDGLDKEKSRKSFVIYDREKFKTLKTGQQRFDYLKSLEVRHINPYTGEIIKN